MRLMKRIHLSLALVAMFASPAAAAVTEAEWFNESMSADERNDLVRRSKLESLEVIGPIVMKARVKYMPSP